MTRLRYGILVFLAIFSILVSNLKADGENNSPQENLVKRHAEPGTEEDELFDDISAEDTKEKVTRVKRSHFWSWTSRRRSTNNRYFKTRPHCEHEDHEHFRTRCCSGKFMDNILLQTCCAGRIVYKNMVPSFCHTHYGCGRFWFDSNRQKCCYGSKGVDCQDIQPTCGLTPFNQTVQACCRGRYLYVIKNQKCCYGRVISRGRTCRLYNR